MTEITSGRSVHNAKRGTIFDEATWSSRVKAAADLLDVVKRAHDVLVKIEPSHAALRERLHQHTGSYFNPRAQASAAITDALRDLETSA